MVVGGQLAKVQLLQHFIAAQNYSSWRLLAKSLLGSRLHSDHVMKLFDRKQIVEVCCDAD